MTQKQAFELARSVGAVIRKTEYGEYRVNYRGGDEVTAYYTDDVEDAAATALCHYSDRRGGK